MGLGSDEARFGPRSMTARAGGRCQLGVLAVASAHTCPCDDTARKFAGPPQSAVSDSAVLTSVTAAAVWGCRLLRCPFEGIAPSHVGVVVAPEASEIPAACALASSVCTYVLRGRGTRVA